MVSPGLIRAVGALMMKVGPSRPALPRQLSRMMTTLFSGAMAPSSFSPEIGPSDAPFFAPA